MGKSSSKDHINHAMNDSVAEPTKIPSTSETIKKLQLQIQMPFVDADAFVADPYALLGLVFQIRKVDGKCPTSLTDGNFSVELTDAPVPRKVSEASKFSKPLLRESIIVDKKLSAEVSFLNYLSTSLSANQYYSLIVFDQAGGLIDMQDPTWQAGLKQWKVDNAALLNDPEICYLFAVSGFIQKNIIRKKYVQYTGKAKGGAFGVNINGELATSTEDYSLDIKFGLTPIVLKRPAASSPGLGIAKARPGKSMHAAKPELQLFAALSGKKISNRKTRKQAR